MANGYRLPKEPTLEEIQDYLINHQDDHARFGAELIFEEHFQRETTKKLTKIFQKEYLEFTQEILATTGQERSPTDQANMEITRELLAMIRTELESRGVILNDKSNEAGSQAA